jgi:hypothetical protein
VHSVVVADLLEVYLNLLVVDVVAVPLRVSDANPTTRPTHLSVEVIRGRPTLGRLGLI